MRLLMLTSEFPPGPGGIGTQAYQLAHHLTHYGWEVSVVASQAYASSHERNSFNSRQHFPIFSLQPKSTLINRMAHRLQTVKQGIRNWQPNLLLATGAWPAYLASWLTGAYCLPVVVIEHGRIPPAWERPLKKWSLRKASAVVCVSQYTRERTLAMDGKLRQVHVIPNGADDDKFTILSQKEVNVFRNRLDFDASHLLLTVGHVSERKGQDIVIRALPYVLREMPNTHYVMVGLPSQQGDFTRLARQLGVLEYIHFVGKVDHPSLVGFLNCCDVFVLTSRYTSTQFEGYGIAVVEAALCGKPAVISRDSGLVEAIVEGSTGYGVPIEDEVKTADAILTLLKDKERRFQMGAAARKRALEGQTWKDRIKQYHELLMGLVLESTRLGECS